MMPNYIYAKIQDMVAINELTYKNLALKLNSAIGEQEYFNGIIEFDAQEYHSTLILTLIVYREPLLDPSDKTHSTTRITDIVPVWWECKTRNESQEVWNDFSWSEFKDYLL